jgi:hypothetical protein
MTENIGSESMISWFQKNIDEEYKMIKQFEQDNIFYFDKSS